MPPGLSAGSTARTSIGLLIGGAGEEMKSRPVMPVVMGMAGQGGREDVGSCAKPLSGHGPCRTGKVQNRDPLTAQAQEVIQKRGGTAAPGDDRRSQW